MKERLIKIGAVLVAFIIIISAIPQVTVSAAPTTYSKSSNSGKRGEVCTSLSGTSASSYYTGSNEYDALSDESPSVILSSLRTLLKTTHKKTTSYSECQSYAEETDCERNGTKLVTLYTSYTTAYTGSINREHVWPKSLGGYKTSGPGADLHHIRPTESTPNSNRGNLRYGNMNGGGKLSSGNASGLDAGHYGTYFEPLDFAKGDVARICLYMYVRYGGESQYTCSSITTVFQSVDVLLEWMELDPVDTWEMGRNEVIQNIQGNRNVFIDYPEYAWLLFDRSVPEDMDTPSGKAGDGIGGGGSGTTGSDRPTETETEAEDVSCGTLDAPLTTTQAYLANKDLDEASHSSDPFYVKGSITSIEEFTGTYYKNVKFTDGDTEVLIYTLNLSSGMSDIEVGDTITVHGYFKNHYGTIEMATSGDTYVTVVKIEADGETDTDAPTEKPTEVPTESETETTVTVETTTETESVVDTAIETELNTETDSDTSTETEASTETSTETGSEAESATDGGTEVESSTETGSESEGLPCAHENTEIRDAESPSCTDGYTGDKYCTDCGELLEKGQVRPAVHDHMFGDWMPDGNSGKEVRICMDCGEAEERFIWVETRPAPETDDAETEETLTETESNEVESEGKTASSCSSSLAAGSVIISAISIAAIAFIRKKEE